MEGDATVEEGGREMESGIDASRRGPMPGSHFPTDTGGPPCNGEKGMDGWMDGERERERFSDVSRPMPYALDRASRLHREEACLSLACVHRRAELEREREREREREGEIGLFASWLEEEGLIGC